MTATGPLDWIEAKKRGHAHSGAELRALVQAVTTQSIPDYQLAAWLMATWQHGLEPQELLAFTEAMRDSGRVLHHPAELEPTADKHSTGGVGDKASLIVAPLAAELGLRVPMISGRGLGHTGGTLDKLQSIEGYRVDLDAEEFARVLADVGCSIIGQTDDMAPADRRLYALRDVTGTVDCVGLIVSSILSKKLAAGPRHLVIDLKCGSGAFMPDLASARELAGALIATGRAAGLRISALVTDMSQPLGAAVGHAVEVREALDCLEGGGPADLRELSIALVVAMAALAGDEDRAVLAERCAAALDNGAAREHFARMVRAHGGTEGFEDRLLIAPEHEPACAARGGYVQSMQTDGIGRALIDLGGGRRRHTDTVDLSVGLEMRVRIGDRVEAGQPLVGVRAPQGAGTDPARQRLRDAIVVGDEPVMARPLVLEQLGD